MKVFCKSFLRLLAVFIFVYLRIIPSVSIALEITNGVPNAVSSTNAWIMSVVVSTNGTTNAVTAELCYGTADGITNAWVNTNAYGAVSGTGSISNKIGNLSPATFYYFRWHITEGTNSAWSPSSALFQTLATAPTNTPAAGPYRPVMFDANGYLVITNLPTATNGLPAGAIYRSSSNLFIHGF